MSGSILRERYNGGTACWWQSTRPQMRQEMPVGRKAGGTAGRGNVAREAERANAVRCFRQLAQKLTGYGDRLVEMTRARRLDAVHCHAPVGEAARKAGIDVRIYVRPEASDGAIRGIGIIIVIVEDLSNPSHKAGTISRESASPPVVGCAGSSGRWLRRSRGRRSPSAEPAEAPRRRS